MDDLERVRQKLERHGAGGPTRHELEAFDRIAKVIEAAHRWNQARLVGLNVWRAEESLMRALDALREGE